MAVQMPQNTAISNPQQSGSKRGGNGKVILSIKEKIKLMVRDVTTRG